MVTKQTKTIWRRVGLIAILFPISAAWPWALLGVGLLAWTIYEDLKPQEFPTPSRRVDWHNATAGDEGWLDMFCARCESPAEEAFLRALASSYELTPVEGVLKSQGLTLDMQVEIGRYRFDFLANGRQVIEIDGATYHSSLQAVERDRIRDELSTASGYRVLRIPASVVFTAPEEAVWRLRAVLIETPEFTNPRPAKSQVPKRTIFQRIRTIGDSLNEFRRIADLELATVEPIKLIDAAFATEARYLSSMVKIADLHLEIERSDPEWRALYDQALAALHDDDGFDQPAEDERLPWPDLTQPEITGSDEVRCKIEAHHRGALRQREARLQQLSNRCASDRRFAHLLAQALNRHGCPYDIALQIAGFGPINQVMFAPFINREAEERLPSQMPSTDDRAKSSQSVGRCWEDVPF